MLRSPLIIYQLSTSQVLMTVLKWLALVHVRYQWCTYANISIIFHRRIITDGHGFNLDQKIILPWCP